MIAFPTPESNSAAATDAKLAADKNAALNSAGSNILNRYGISTRGPDGNMTQADLRQWMNQAQNQIAICEGLDQYFNSVFGSMFADIADTLRAKMNAVSKMVPAASQVMEPEGSNSLGIEGVGIANAGNAVPSWKTYPSVTAIGEGGNKSSNPSPSASIQPSRMI